MIINRQCGETANIFIETLCFSMGVCVCVADGFIFIQTVCHGQLLVLVNAIDLCKKSLFH